MADSTSTSAYQQPSWAASDTVTEKFENYPTSSEPSGSVVSASEAKPTVQVVPLIKPRSRYRTPAPQKSIGLAFVLTFFFGPLGLLYSSVSGAAVLFCVGIFLTVVTQGQAAILVWIASMVWGCIAANQRNDAGYRKSPWY